MRFTKRFSASFSYAGIVKFFAQQKYTKRVVCDWCGSYLVYRPETALWRCRRCWRYFDITTGTFLGTFRAPLRFWYEVLCCFALQYSAHKAHRFLKTPAVSESTTGSTISKKWNSGTITDTLISTDSSPCLSVFYSNIFVLKCHKTPI